MGNKDGETLYFQNIGSATAASFAAPLTNAFGLSDVGNFAAPTFADLDGDDAPSDDARRLRDALTR